LKRTLWSIRQNLDIEAELIVQTRKWPVARNRLAALKWFHGDVVIFMDDDVLLPPFFASKMIASLSGLKDAGVVSAVMTNPDGSRQNDMFCEPHQTIQGIPPGTCFCYSKKRVRARFDDKYLASQWEDTDFMVQVLKQGLQTYATGSVHIIHDNNWTGHTNDTWETNRQRFARKWPEWSA